jgi:hypothetical protein
MCIRGGRGGGGGGLTWLVVATSLALTVPASALANSKVHAVIKTTAKNFIFIKISLVFDCFKLSALIRHFLYISQNCIIMFKLFANNQSPAIFG